MCFEACAKSVSAEGREAPVQPTALKAECFPFCSQGGIGIRYGPQKQAEGYVHTANGEMCVKWKGEMNPIAITRVLFCDSTATLPWARRLWAPFGGRQ